MSAEVGSERPSQWTCAECGCENVRTLTCERCGVARAWQEDPPLDLPPPPGWLERPEAWMAMLHAAAAVGGLVLAWRPEIAPFLALAQPWQGIQIALSVGATAVAVNRAAMGRLFHEVALAMPAHARTDEAFDVELRLTPYQRIEGVSIVVDLVENTYDRSRGDGSELKLKSRRLARHVLQSGAPLRGRRVHHVETSFLAPFPNMNVHDTLAEIQASILAPFAWLVPGLGETARNLREHGGVRVRAKVAVGPFRRVIERRIIVYVPGSSELLAG